MENIIFLRPDIRDSKGLTILELAVAMIIMGVVIAGILSIINPMIESGKIKETEKKMERIVDIMAVYAQRNNRLPCPADPDRAATAQPFGAETGSGSDGDGLGSCDGAGDLIEGIVPYKTLGLSRQDIVDGWGSDLTYRVNPTYARDPSAAGNNTVHARCRVNMIWIDPDTGQNFNPAKARFCCANSAQSANDIVIEDEDNELLWPFTRDTGNDADPDTPVASDTIFDPGSENTTMPAFILISHGRNGYGAYLDNGFRMEALGNSGIDEDENQDGDDNFVMAPRNMSGGNDYFDDIAIWRTQDQLYSETGEGSCVFP